MARKLGWSKHGSPDSAVRGKSVAIIGQGQNGLIAAQVMRMMGATEVSSPGLALDPPNPHTIHYPCNARVWFVFENGVLVSS